jgi:hypothetical protein
LGDGRRGVKEPEVLEDLESEDSFLPAFGRTHPFPSAGPSGVRESSGALLERECFMCRVDDEVFLLRWCVRCLARSLFVPEGTRANEERESLWESCSKVFIASIRDALDKLRRA